MRANSERGEDREWSGGADLGGKGSGGADLGGKGSEGADLGGEGAGGAGKGAEELGVEARRAMERELRRILAKQAEGKALTGVEWRRLEKAAAADQVEEEAAEAERVANGRGEALELVAEPVVRLGTLKEVAAAYGYSLRQVKNWVREGRKAKDACPYERPEEMPAWFERVFAPRECPDRLRSAVEQVMAGAPVREEAARSPGGPAGPRVVREEELEESEVGFEATLRRARRREAMLDLRLRAAIESGDPRTDAIETQWGKAASRVRELEKAAPAILEAQGVYVRREAVRRSLVEVGGRIEEQIRSELRRRWRAIRAAESVSEFEAEVSEGLAAGLQELVKSGFAAPLVLEVAG